MGKIRIKTFDESSEQDEAKLRTKKEAKKAEKTRLQTLARSNSGQATKKNAEKTPIAVAEVAAPEEIVITPSETVSAEVVTNVNEAISEEKPSSAKATEGQAKKTKKEKFVKANKKVESKRHKENMGFVSKTQKYNLTQAIETLKKFKKGKFDETVELHINTKEKGVSGQVTLPHGTGKTLVIKIADDAILAEVAKGKISFDVLVATPSMMPSLAKVAKILGPRGLMPNPKNGTIAEKPEEAVKKLSGGQINYKTEAEFPIIHAIVGKISFDDNKLKDNVKTFLTSVGSDKISSATLKSTMSPAIRLNSTSL
jgi:large subunit ribosomal protein L1